MQLGRKHPWHCWHVLHVMRPRAPARPHLHLPAPVLRQQVAHCLVVHLAAGQRQAAGLARLLPGSHAAERAVQAPEAVPRHHDEPSLASLPAGSTCWTPLTRWLVQASDEHVYGALRRHKEHAACHPVSTIHMQQYHHWLALTAVPPAARHTAHLVSSPSSSGSYCCAAPPSTAGE